MKFKETIKKDWRVDIGILINIVFIVYFFVAILTKSPFIYLLLIYLFGILIALLIGAVDYFSQALVFPFLLFAYYETDKEQAKVNKYLKGFNQNTHKKAVVILAYYDRYSVKYGLKENYFLKEIKLITEYLKLSYTDDFSFYFGASPDNVKEIMFDPSVREVLFVGHGDSHTFVLNSENEVYYCDFNNVKCYKDIIHQVHCGTKTGKTLVEYVVPLKNHHNCFFPRKAVREADIKKWFKKRIIELQKINN